MDHRIRCGWHDVRDSSVQRRMFCTSVGLPVTLAQIGLHDPSDALLPRIAERATIASDTIHNEPFQVTASAVLQAIKRADTAGRAAIQ